MNESKKIIVVISVIVVLLLGTLGFVYADSKDSKQIYDQFLEAFNREENTLIYLGSETCGYCSLLTPSLEDMKERYGLDYVYFEISDIIIAMDNSNVAALGAMADAGQKAKIHKLTDFLPEEKRIRYKTDEVPDPYYGGPKGFELVLDMLEDAMPGVLEFLDN